MFKKIICLIISGCLIFCFTGCSNSSISNKCGNCGIDVEETWSFCPSCGTTQTTNQNGLETPLSDSQKIIGTWQTTDYSYGLFEYTFYSDGSCQGKYIGELTENLYGKQYWNTVAGVYPSVYPDSFKKGCGDGTWSFVDGNLKIIYNGENREGRYPGTQYYAYSFNEDNTELTIHGTKQSNDTPGTAVWEKIN